MSDPVISINGFSKSYVTLRGSVDAVRDLNLDVEAGSVVAFVGPNGAGKTTTIYSMLGLLTPTQGTITLFGSPSGSVAAQRRLGFLSEIFYTYPYLTGRDAMRFYGRLSGLALDDIDRRIPAQLERLGLADAVDRKVSSFSKGMVQRLGLAQALLHHPDLLILDEPTTGLDPEGRKLVADMILEEKARGTTVFLSSHILSDVERTCDRVVMIRKGRVVLEEAIATLDGAGNSWVLEVRRWRPEMAAPLQALDGEVISADGDSAVLGCAEDKKDDLLRWLLSSEADVVALRRGRRSLEDLYMQHVGGSSDG